ncbi:MAG: hypothetical protein ABH951_00360 [Patescibacteria group bacterium]
MVKKIIIFVFATGVMILGVYFSMDYLKEKGLIKNDNTQIVGEDKIQM